MTSRNVVAAHRDTDAVQSSLQQLATLSAPNNSPPLDVEPTSSQIYSTPQALSEISQFSLVCALRKILGDM